MKSTLNFHWKDWCWSSNTLATWGNVWTHWKRPWCWERWKAWGEGMTQDEMVGWHHRLKGHEFEHTPGDGEGQGSLVCYSPWDHKQSDMTEWLKSNHKSSKKQFNWKQHAMFGYNVMRNQNCAKHLEFTSHFSIKEHSHTSSPTYLYLIWKPRYSLMWAKRKFRPSMPWPMWNSPALSPFAIIKVKAVSLCSLKPFLNLCESLLCSPQKSSLWEWWIFHTLWGYVSSVSTSKTNFGWRIHPVSVEWWQQLAPRFEYWDAVRHHQVSFLPSLAFKLTLLYAGEHAQWATALWLTCALTLLLCAVYWWVPAEALTNINQFSQLSYSERIIGLGPSLKLFWIVYLNLHLIVSRSLNHV